MVKNSFSWWGIKDSGEDITAEMMRIINNAKQFIIVCGYNFTFRTSAGARPFFDALTAKSLIGIHVLLIFPPKLHGKYNPQPAIIHHCLTNNLPIILNHENHSKWLLTDNDLYYGSSNFTKASWTKRVEVLSIHEHTSLGQSWSSNTIKDFKKFIDSEIVDLSSPKRRMKNYRGLLTSTRNIWKSIKPLVHKLNPSIEKVISTLGNYEEIVSKLNENIVSWFDYYTENEFRIIFNLNSEILNSVDALCEYAYGNIYNETIYSEGGELSQVVIDEYNSLYENVILVLEDCVKKLPIGIETSDQRSELVQSNLSKINYIQLIINDIIQ